MIDLSEVKNIYLYTSKVDMRMGISKIEAILSLSFNPIEMLNACFIFVSGNRRQIKIYYENEFGKWLLINKLSFTKFMVPTLDNVKTITKRDLSLLLKGVMLIDERQKMVSI